ncbi:hypothetical protein EJ02DRAFT_451091 [Clathrospora elynae]|uniref:Arrestin-like N-terminal domain-containing protein n=1 Tax=Clathrospora elynae TaxID=706981 RepID=A0A6A5T5F7_9PLEO|nr:hypothetical protein EJ02DRAFT_451091 [Clathrospora elynae]
MGLFSSSKIPQPPLPNLAIHLHNPTDKVFRPDDVVTGHIELTPVTSITPEAILVSLFGQSLIWHRTSSNDMNNHTTYHHWRDNAPLFEVTEELVRSRDTKLRTLEPGRRYTFPFSFRFPRGTGNTRAGQYKQDSDERFTIYPHDLPPSFFHKGKFTDGTEPDWARIEYGVRVKLVCPGVGVVQGKQLVDFGATLPILFQPLNAHLQRQLSGPLTVVLHPKTFTLQSSTLTGQPPSQIGFRRSIHDRFSSATPKLDFEAALEIPDILSSGSEFRFRAFFTVASKTANVVHIPAITFTILKLDLLDFTFYRAPRDREANTSRGGAHRRNKYETLPAPDQPFEVAASEYEEFTERKTHLNSLPDSATLELEEVPSYTPLADKKEVEMEQAKSCEVWFTARVPSVTPPSFRSFAITRAYRVKTKLGLEVGGKKFELEAESSIREMGSMSN